MNKKFQCTAPWSGLHINPDGNVKVCCAGDSLGNLNKQSLQEVLTGQPLSQLQKDMVEKGYSDHCHTCMNMEKESGRSLREQFSTNLADVDLTTFSPTNIDIRWTNTCQLRCAYCCSEWSTAYANWKGDLGKVSERKWQDEVLQFLATFNGKKYKFVAMLGGEPLMLKENIKLLDLLDSEQQITVLSNLSLDNIETLPVYKRLLEKRTSWHISFETIGNKFEYTRKNAKWETTKRNYLKLRDSVNDKSVVGLHMTYCILSAFSLAETFDWLSSVGPCHHILSTLIGPAQFSITSFPGEIKELAIREIDLTIKRHREFLSPALKSFLENTRAHLVQTKDVYNTENVKAFKEFIIKSDSEITGYSFASEWPEVAAILERY